MKDAGLGSRDHNGGRCRGAQDKKNIIYPQIFGLIMHSFALGQIMHICLYQLDS